MLEHTKTTPHQDSQTTMQIQNKLKDIYDNPTTILTYHLYNNSLTEYSLTLGQAAFWGKTNQVPTMK